MEMKLALVFLAAVFLITACSRPAPTNEISPEIAKAFSDAGLSLLSRKIMARDFSLPVAGSAMLPGDIAGNISLEELKGNVVFLNFWATWCPPCRYEMPSMEALYNRYRDRNFVMLAVNIGERAEQVNNFMTEYNLSFPALLDRDSALSRTFMVQAIPVTCIIDSDGNIILRITGSIDWDTPEIHRAIELLLE